MLSRIEAGERSISADELEDLLNRIGTPEAEALKRTLGRRWNHLAAPPLDHADEELLWAAEQAAEALARQAQADGIRPAFSKRLEEYLVEIKLAAKRLQKREHSVAFIGAIGIGKSTAICKATGLEIHGPKGQLTPVLETGAGGITLCEVTLRVGPDYGVIVVPRTTEEIRVDVADFAELLLARSGDNGLAGDGDEGKRAVPRELERAIRNLSGLRPTRLKGVDGRPVRQDPAKDLAAQIGSARELTVEILSRMDLPRRDRREAWFDAASNRRPLEWLRDTFEELNNGRHPDFSLPARVDLIVPRLMETGDLTVSIVDTRGIDRVTARADLEEYLLDSHTVAILCSGFNDAPAQPIQRLLERAREIGNAQIDSHASVLVLPRAGEALAVKDESGIRAESDEEGYELKGEQVTTALTPFDMQDLPVRFFNSYEDDPALLGDFMIDRIASTREGFRGELQTIVDNARELLENVERQQVLEVQRDASRIILAWLDRHTEPQGVPDHIHDTLMEEICRAHASTINATIRREGEWYSLSYSHQLGFGARRVAVSSLRSWVGEFKGHCDTLLTTHPEASELLAQAARLMDQAYDDLLRKMQIAGAALYRQELQRAQVLWMELASEWGKGGGYRDRVARRQGSWFGEEAQHQVEQEILRVMGREWKALRDRVAGIFDDMDRERAPMEVTTDLRPCPQVAI